jgi:hypothetical protein
VWVPSLKWKKVDKIVDVKLIYEKRGEFINNEEDIRRSFINNPEGFFTLNDLSTFLENLAKGFYEIDEEGSLKVGRNYRTPISNRDYSNGRDPKQGQVSQVNRSNGMPQIDNRGPGCCGCLLF